MHWAVVDCMQAAKAIFVLVERLEGSRTNLSVCQSTHSVSVRSVLYSIRYYELERLEFSCENDRQTDSLSYRETSAPAISSTSPGADRSHQLKKAASFLIHSHGQLI